MITKLLSASLLLGCCTLLACQHEHDCDPAPSCYSGTVVGNTCMDGMLIDMDPSFGIGAQGLLPRAGRPDSLLGQHVVAVVNTDELGPLPTVGQRLYFTYVNDPDRQWNMRCCFDGDGVRGQVPRLVLSNVSTSPCQQAPRTGK